MIHYGLSRFFHKWIRLLSPCDPFGDMLFTVQNLDAIFVYIQPSDIVCQYFFVGGMFVVRGAWLRNKNRIHSINCILFLVRFLTGSEA